MKKIFTLIALTIFSAGAFAQNKTAGTSKVTFNVDMTPAIDGGTFTPGTDFVDVAGTFNNWAGGTMLTRVATSSIYTFHLDTLTDGAQLEFKFRVNGTWDDNTTEFPFGGPARKYTVKNKDIYNGIYNDTTVVITGIPTISNDIKSLSNYPNPAKDQLNFAYTVVNTSDVTIKLYDVLGAEVKSIVSEKQFPGVYKQTTDLSDIRNGLYFYVLNVNGKPSQSGKIQIVK